MSQVFAGDAVMSTAAITVPTTAETTAVIGNFVNPPFGNAKAVISGMVYLNIGAGTTSLSLRIRRNPTAENALIWQLTGVSCTAGNNTVLFFSGADSIPDGRPVQYALTLVQSGATGNGGISQASVSTLLISG